MLYYKFYNPEPIYYFCEIEYIFKTEQWLPVVGYEGIYEVSDLGRIKSLERYIVTISRWGKQMNKKVKESILVIYPNTDYLNVVLSGNGRKKLRAHRIVAEAFIPNPDNKPQVNHIKGNKYDNRSIMLEWNTGIENIKHAYNVLGKKANKTNLGNLDELSSSSIPVLQFDLNGNFIQEFPGGTTAARKLGLNQSKISLVCNGKRKQTEGFIWKFKQ